MKRVIMTVAGLAVSAIGLWLAFRRVAWPELRTALGSARWLWLGAFAAANVSTLGWRALQLQAAARRRDGARPGLAACFRAVCIGMLAQTILPARLGEPARVVAIVKDGHVAPAVAVGAIVLARVLDLVALLVVTCVPPIVLHLAAAAAGPLHAAAHIGSAVAAALVLGTVVAWLRRARLARWAHRLRPWLGHALGGFLDGLSALGSPGRLLVLSLVTLAVPATVALAYYFGLRAFSLALPPGTSLVLVAAVFLAIAVPAAPSAVGVYHAVAGWVLGALGAPAAAAAAFAVATHAIGVVEFIVLGAIALARVGTGLLPPDRTEKTGAGGGGGGGAFPEADKAERAEPAERAERAERAE